MEDFYTYRYAFGSVSIPIPEGWTADQVGEHMREIWGNWFVEPDVIEQGLTGKKIIPEISKDLRFDNPGEMIPGWSLRT